VQLANGTRPVGLLFVALVRLVHGAAGKYPDPGHEPGLGAAPNEQELEVPIAVAASPPQEQQ